MTVLVPAISTALALVLALLLAAQWRERRSAFQLAWAAGMLAYAAGTGAEAIAAASGWSEPVYRAWYLAGAVWTAGWLGLGTAFLLARTRFGYTYAACILLSGIVTLVIRNNPAYEGAGLLPVLNLVASVVVALAVGVDTYFGGSAWPRIAAAWMGAISLLALVLVVTTPPLPAPGWAVDPATGQPVGSAMPGAIRLLTPMTNVTGALALLLGALFSAYVFMPKRRVLPYSLDPTQAGDQFLFNLCIAPVAIVVNLVASLPAAARELLAGRLHPRVPSTLLIALGAFVPALTDSLNRAGWTDGFALGKLLGVVLILAGFLVSAEIVREVRIPFTGIRLAVAGRQDGDRR